MFDHIPIRPLATSPPGIDDAGIAVGRQAECVYGRFGDTNATGFMLGSRAQRIKPIRSAHGINFFASDGMSACSAIFMLHGHAANAVGAVIHYDNGGDPGEVLVTVLRYYGLGGPDSVLQARTCIVTHAAMDMTGRSAYRSLKEAGFLLPERREHQGAAAMDVSGRYFNPYT